MIWMPEIIKITARKLRKNMTLAEIKLWDYIRKWKILNKQFQKQKPIFVYEENSWLPRYIIADFYCPENKLIIELDWSIHEVEEVLILDKFKEELLINDWYNVVRFKNEEIFGNIEKVLEEIRKGLENN
jgi:very-short-patch-repair endonuclease